MRHICIACFLGLLITGCSDPTTQTAERPPDPVRTDVEAAMTSLNTMRESLAGTIQSDDVDKATFARVCKPVGMRAKTIGAENGWTVQQMAEKYRNPAHQLDAAAQAVHNRFADDSTRIGTWQRATMDGTDGWRYFHRIPVREGCLACHGPKAQRPDFVKQGYPQDRAYGFSPGDLRGLYSVFVPDSTVQASTVDAPDGGE